MIHLILLAILSAAPVPQSDSSMVVTIGMGSCITDATKQGVSKEKSLYFCSCVIDAARAELTTEPKIVVDSCLDYATKAVAKKLLFGLGLQRNPFQQTQMSSASISRGMLECQKNRKDDIESCACSMDYLRVVFRNKGSVWILNHLGQLHQEQHNQCQKGIEL
jgi:hypothetical protein